MINTSLLLCNANLKDSHTKSRKGCETCKRRHIRCDENFPQWYVEMGFRRRKLWFLEGHN